VSIGARSRAFSSSLMSRPPRRRSLVMYFHGYGRPAPRGPVTRQSSLREQWAGQKKLGCDNGQRADLHFDR
jgi:hypothetical protein